MPQIGDHFTKASYGGNGTFTDLPGQLVLIDDLDTSNGNTGQIRASSSSAMAAQGSRNTNRAIKVTDDSGNVCLITDGIMQLGYPHKDGQSSDLGVNNLLVESPYARDNDVFNWTMVTTSNDQFYNRNILAIPPVNENVTVNIKPFGSIVNSKTNTTIQDGYYGSTGSLHKYQYVITEIKRQENTGRTGAGEIIYRDPLSPPIVEEESNVQSGRKSFLPGIKKFELGCYKDINGQYYPRFNIEMNMKTNAVVQYTNKTDISGNPDWENIDSDENWFAQYDLQEESIDAQEWNGTDNNVWYDFDGYSFFTADSQVPIDANVFPCYARVLCLQDSSIDQFGDTHLINDITLYFPFESSTTDDQGNTWNFWTKQVDLPIPAEGTNVCSNEWDTPGSGTTGNNKFVMSYPTLSVDRSFVWQEVDSHGSSTEKINHKLQTQDIQIARLDEYAMVRTVSIRYRSDNSVALRVANELKQEKTVSLPSTNNKIESREFIIGLRCKYVNVSIEAFVDSTQNDFEIHQIELGYH